MSNSILDQVSPSIRKHIEIVHNLEELSDAVTALENFVKRVKGEGIAKESTSVSPPIPAPSLSQFLSTAGESVNQLEQRIREQLNALDELLF